MQLLIKKCLCHLLLAMFVSLRASVCFADEIPLTAEENIELDCFRRVASLLPFEQQLPDTLKQALLKEGFSLITDEQDNFGVRTLEFKKNAEHLGAIKFGLHVYQEEIEAYFAHFATPDSEDFLKKKEAIWQAHGGVKPRNQFASLISKNRLHEEIEDVEQLMQLMPFEKQDPSALKQNLMQLGYQANRDETDPFGLNKTTLIKENHYKTMTLDLASFNGSLTSYKVNIESKPMASSRLEPHRYDDIPLDSVILSVWQKNKGKESWSNRGVFVEDEFEEVLQNYYQVAIAGKDELAAVNVPKDLLDDYARLVSDVLEYSAKGKDDVFDNLGYLASESEMAVLSALDNLLKNDRIDLIENVLNGFNPMARVCAIAKLERLGLADSLINKSKIANIFAQNAPVNFCGTQLTSTEYYGLVKGDQIDLAARCPRH
ncbi:MAG: hypothetical protein ABL933_03310 [Methyloglobulus sp.]|nr:hypothetical protein [Methyloglobulus sp.]